MPMRTHKHFLYVCSFVVGSSSFAEVGVVYPTVPKPYNAAFLEVIAGIKTAGPPGLLVFEYSPKESNALLEAWLQEHQLSRIVALGKSSVKRLSNMRGDFSLISALHMTALSRQYQTNRAIVYVAEPKILFARLKLISPNSNRIHVILDQKKNQWILTRAQAACVELACELFVHHANNLKSSAVLYKKVLKKLNSQTDALWLPTDHTMNDSVILPLVLKYSWKRNLKVMSNKTLHAHKGVLLAMQPDRQKFGEYLGRLLSVETIPEGETTEAIKQLNSVLNIRMVRHLNLSINKDILSHFDSVAPKDYK